VESVESQRPASHAFHEPLGNLAKGGRDSHIPTAPTTKADGKVENQKQVFHFPTATIPYSQNRKHKNRRRASPSARPGASRLAIVSESLQGQRALWGAGLNRTKPTKGDIAQQAQFSGSPRIGIAEPFQAHLALESILDFRLICGLENAYIVYGKT
jgi:hypothetical protein